MIEITDVTSLAADPLAGAALDVPQAGASTSLPLLELTGWVVGKRRRVGAVEVTHGPFPLRKTGVDLHRDRVAARFPDAPGAEAGGFRTKLGALGLPPQFELTLHALLDGGGRVPFVRVRGTRTLLRTPFEPSLRPLMLTSLGRTGTTWAMRLLSEHPDVVVHRRYPYEVRPARYWLHAAKVLTEPANHFQSSHPDTFHANPALVGHNPFYTPAVTDVDGLEQWLATEHVERTAAYAQEEIERYYVSVANARGPREPKYFAEKYLPDMIPWLVWELYPRAAEVFLVRDPRDMFLSMVAFNEKRGFASFGRESVDTDADFLRRLRGDVARLLDAWKSRADRAFLLRYEELVGAPEQTLRALFDHLELDSAPATIAAVLAQASDNGGPLAAHTTSSDAAASVGRWKKDIDRWRDGWDEAFGDLLPELGYA